MGSKTALVLGGSGAVGTGIVKALAKCPQYEKVTLLGRKPIELPASSSEIGGSNYAKFEQKTMDFDNIPQHAPLFCGYSASFYAIGVSSNKVSEEVYRKIELDNAIALGKLMKEGSCPDIHWVTGGGTSKTSWYLFGRVKAEVEETVGQMGFNRVVFYRPGGILADKSSSMGPKTTTVMRVLDPLHCISIEADLLGEVMVANSLKEIVDGVNVVEILENSEINKMGKAMKK